MKSKEKERRRKMSLAYFINMYISFSGFEVLLAKHFLFPVFLYIPFL